MDISHAIIMASATVLSTICPAEPIDIHREALSGGRMSAEQAEELEAAVRTEPDHVSARAKLLGYYFLARHRNREAGDERRKHVLWVIENHPASDLAASPYCGMDSASDPEGYVQAKTLWIAQTKDHSKDAGVLGNAGRFFLIQDRDLAEDFLKQAQEADPENPQRSDDLGQFYSLSDKKGDAAKSLEYYGKAQHSDKEEMSRFYRLNQLAKAAFKAGDMDRAGRFAEQSLAEAERFPKDWNHGNAVHHGNSVLGLCALEQGDLKLAGEYLIEAGRTQGSPQLDSFGPNMLLAKSLVEKGEDEKVLEYFSLCRKFWKSGAARLDRWSMDVKAGNIPEFGGNLRY